MTKRFRKSLLLALLLLAGAGLFLVWPSKAARVFRIVEDFSIFNVNDAGIADLNDDGWIDLWTTNHSAAQWVRLGPFGNGEENSAGPIGLYQDSTLPGFETAAGPIPQNRPVRIYMDGFHFVIDVAGSGADQPITGYFDIPWDIEAESTGAADIARKPCDTFPDCRRLHFFISDGGRVRVLPIPAPSDGFEIGITLGEEVDLADVQIGALAIQPEAHSFSFRSRDRHSMAMITSVPEDDALIFIGRGGARGRLTMIEPDARDEMFHWDGAALVDVMPRYRLEKEACPARQSAWQDVNGDGLADLYLVCGRSGGEIDNSNAANLLYVQDADGRFHESGAAFGLDLAGVGIFRFLPRRGSNSLLSMLWVAEEELALFAQDGTAFKKLWSRPRQGSGTEKVMVSDFDTDGVWDAFVFSPRGNQSFAITETGPMQHDLASLGLPAASSDGIYADLDGDGHRDMMTAPQGIFLAQDHGFRQSDLIDLTWTEGHPVRLAVFDRDADGDLDVWCLVQNGALTWRVWRAIYNRVPEGFQKWFEEQYGIDRFRSRYWRAAFYENTADTGTLHRLGLHGATAVEITIRPASDTAEDYTVNLYPGIDEPSRFSGMFPDILVSVPQGGEIIDIAPIPAGATYEMR